MKSKLIQDEKQILKKAKETAEKFRDKENELLPEYEVLLKNYERLMKHSTKTNRISDMLNKMLQTREDEIQQANDRLIKLQDSRRQFISDITHEMGAPMAAVQNYLKVIIENKLEASTENLSLLYDQIVMVNKLIKELFELSILEDPATKLLIEKAPVSDLCKIITDFKFEVEDQGLIFKQNLIIDQEDIYIQFDKLRIKQVLNNLIYNAFRFTPEGNWIEVRMEIKQTAEQEEVVVEVIDSGSGIEQEAIPYIFERFYKGKEMGGTGLGLAIAKEIIALHGGQIGVKSKLNVGSTFYFTIPIDESVN